MPLDDLLLKVRLVDELGRFLKGTVDLEVVHRRRRRRIVHRHADASGEIHVRGIRPRRTELRAPVHASGRFSGGVVRLHDGRRSVPGDRPEK